MFRRARRQRSDDRAPCGPELRGAWAAEGPAGTRPVSAYGTPLRSRARRNHRPHPRVHFVIPSRGLGAWRQCCAAPRANGMCASVTRDSWHVASPRPSSRSLGRPGPRALGAETKKARKSSAPSGGGPPAPQMHSAAPHWTLGLGRHKRGTSFGTAVAVMVVVDVKQGETERIGKGRGLQKQEYESLFVVGVRLLLDHHTRVLERVAEHLVQRLRSDRHVAHAVHRRRL